MCGNFVACGRFNMSNYASDRQFELHFLGFYEAFQYSLINQVLATEAYLPSLLLIGLI